MDINLSALNMYKTSAKKAAYFDGKAGGTAAVVSASSKDKTQLDTISISQEAADRRDVSMMAKSVLGSMRGLENPARLDAIAKAIEDGSYYVSAQDLADHMLDGMLAG